MFGYRTLGFGVNNAIAAAGGVSIIESIQQVEITIASGTNAGNTTITEVDLDYSVIFIDYGKFGGLTQTDTGGNTDDTNAYAFLSNSTTVGISRSSFASFAITAVVTVVEFKSTAVDSIQWGYTFGTGAADTAAITSVTTSRTSLLYAGCSSYETGTDQGDSLSSLELTSSTLVTANRDVSTANLLAAFWVIEFATGITDSIEEFEVAITGDTATSATTTITSVTTSRTMLFPGGQRSDTAALEVDRDSGYLELTNGTTATLTRNTGNAADIAIVATAVQFDADHIDSIQRGTVTMATGDTTKDVTVTSVTTSLSLLSALSCTSTSSSAIAPEQQFFTSEIVDSTTIRFTKGATGRDVILSWELVEFF